MITEKSLIDREWVSSDHKFNSVTANNGEETKQSYATMGKGEVRLNGEHGRKTGKPPTFANYIREGHYCDSQIDRAQPDRSSASFPDLLQIGPVAVFGASSFPLAFSTAGGDVRLITS